MAKKQPSKFKLWSGTPGQSEPIDLPLLDAGARPVLDSFMRFSNAVPVEPDAGTDPTGYAEWAQRLANGGFENQKAGYDYAGYQAALDSWKTKSARVETVNAKRTASNDRRRADYGNFLKGEKDKQNQQILDALAAATTQPEPPPPTLSSSEALAASSQARADAARRNGMRRSLIAGDTGGYVNTATGRGSLLG